MKSPIQYLLVLLLVLNVGCSTLPKNERATASVTEDCVDLLKKFLPDNERVKIKSVEIGSGLRPLEKELEVESTNLFNTFEKEAKSLASVGKFKLLVDPHEALMSRVMLIRKAKKSIDLTYYIFQDSEASKILITELQAALRRGVNVRLMVDGSGSAATAANAFKELQVLTHTLGGKILNDEGQVVGQATFEAIEINPMFNVRATVKAWYNKVAKLVTGKEAPLDDFGIFHRSHDKILMIDAHSPEDSMAIIGGRNISNHYYKIGTQAEQDSTFNDLDILVKNVAYTESTDEKAVVKNALLDHFNRLYFYSANKRFENFVFKLSRDIAAKTLSVMRKTRNEMIRSNGEELYEVLKKMEDADFLNSNFDEGYVSFLHEIQNLVRKNPLKNTSYDNNHDSIIKNMWNQIDKADKDILICSPYVYFTDVEIHSLVNWLKADSTRTFRLITNSSATSDNLFAQSMVEYFVMPKLIGELKKAGISEKQYEILAYGNLANKEFGGTVAQGKLHAKFYMVDNYTMGVGTSNFDPISRLTNSEIVANIFPTNGTNSVTALNAYYKTLKENSSRWNSEDFIKAKMRPQLKTKLMIQSFISKVIGYFDLLPQETP